MSPFKEFEGKYEPDGFKIDLEKTRRLRKGREVILIERRSGILRNEIITRITACAIDDDTLQLKIQRLREPVANAGIIEDKRIHDIDTFGFPVQSYENKKDSNGRIIDEWTYSSSEHTRQDIWVEDDHGNVHGIMWVDSEGFRKKPVLIQGHRSFYKGDSDPEALKVFERHSEIDTATP
ncbi:hypothetical protein A2Z22_04465 [Candidatus Woesebacteria bacterium RBG_16_34_12]|uniref:Uncharacterized protein n=1 Tax=Candidatus Woesebacteria bacterium RBG_16_34_12 TaxID=1802480 RepID=A0A1F7XBU1_9BACT|nr:MAG: hypothetical protein A2Z22_04465 [Candidatus Woesebacteria bacterium RBG_16_34_12]